MRLRDGFDVLADRWWTVADHAVFAIGSHWRFVVGFVLGVTSLVVSPTDSTLGLVGLAIGAGMLAWDLRDWHVARRRMKTGVSIETDPDAAATFLSMTLPEGHERWTFGEGVAAVSPAINRAISRHPAPLRGEARPYVLPWTLRPWLARVIAEDRPSFNETKVRLAADPTPEGLAAHEPLAIQKTDYFKGRLTNESVGRRFMEIGPSGPPLPALRLMDLLGDRDGLIPLSRSWLSNHIGVTTLMITADDRLVLQAQGGAQMIDRGRLSLGASGSADWSDWRRLRERTLQGLAIRAVEREAVEEVGAPVSGMASAIIGYARYLHRGGKPELFGVTATTAAANMLKVRPAERGRFVDTLLFLPFGGEAPPLTTVIDGLLAHDSHDGRPISFSMHMGLKMAARWLADNPDGLQQLRARLDSASPATETPAS